MVLRAYNVAVGRALRVDPYIYLSDAEKLVRDGRTSSYSGASKHGRTTLLLAPDVIGNEADRGGIERQVRSMTGRSDAVVTAVRRRVDSKGRLAGYEVDIR